MKWHDHSVGAQASDTVEPRGRVVTRSFAPSHHKRVLTGAMHMQVYDSLAELVGNTPLVRLKKVTRDIAADVLAKVEYVNPGGSV